jgi:hypothetical protein
VNKISRILGYYNEALADSQESLTVAFSPRGLTQQHWRKNTLIAHFIADYLATSLSEASSPGTSSPGTSSPETSSDPKASLVASDHFLLPWQAELQDQVNFITNELLENAVKFCDRTAEVPISLTLRLFADSVVFEVSNALTAETVEQFQILIQTLLAEDARILLLRQLERNAVEPNTGSRLGFLTIMSDYQARLGWKFEPLPLQSDLEMYLVTIMVYLKR